MATRNIVTNEDPALRKVCREVEVFTPRLGVLLDDMKETMLESNGVGLAAPQVGVLRRAIVVFRGEDDIIEMINPMITMREGEQTGMEGCLSVPGKYGIVTRPMKIRARYQDRKGNFCEVEAEEFLARIICHETDHLNGILYTDNVVRMLTDEELAELEQKKGES